MNSLIKNYFSRSGLLMGLAIVALNAGAQNVYANGEAVFPTAEAAVTALTNAAVARDTNAIKNIFGPEGQELVSPDVIQASESFSNFVNRVSEKTELFKESDTKATLQIGNEGWPFPIPLIKQSKGWAFDVAAGKEEIIARRVGENELGAIEVVHAYVDAQREYAGRDRIGDGVLQYAQHLRSTQGKHDGLYWPVKAGTEELSPFGPLISEARSEGYHQHSGFMTDKNPEQTPYHGYYFKILTKQGKHAAGGKYDYIINGRMIGGFALIAWPVEWDNAGVMTFMVNQQGIVFQKDLGSKTAKLAPKIKTFDPDSSWKPVYGQSAKIDLNNSAATTHATPIWSGEQFSFIGDFDPIY